MTGYKPDTNSKGLYSPFAKFCVGQILRMNLSAMSIVCAEAKVPPIRDFIWVSTDGCEDFLNIDRRRHPSAARPV